MKSNEQLKYIFLIIGIFTIGISVSIYNIYFKPLPADFIEAQLDIPKEQDLSVQDLPKIKEKKVIVHISGAVVNPGVYLVTKNIRIMNIFDVAGGLLPQADLDKVNLAKKIKDGQRIYVPYQKSSKKHIYSLEVQFPIDINQASVAELTSIPGIGEQLAKRIILDRQINGYYHSIQDLQRVKGIGAKKLNRMRVYIK